MPSTRHNMVCKVPQRHISAGVRTHRVAHARTRTGQRRVSRVRICALHNSLFQVLRRHHTHNTSNMFRICLIMTQAVAKKSKYKCVCRKTHRMTTFRLNLAFGRGCTFSRSRVSYLRVYWTKFHDVDVIITYIRVQLLHVPSHTE
jgi:hypothetical protein